MMDYYEALGIPRDADKTRINQGWVRQMWLNTPDRDSEAYHLLNEARATLLDPRARADYDAQLEYGEETLFLFDEAFQSKEEGQWDRAVALFKVILLKHPSSLDARNQLCICLRRAGLYSESCDRFRPLLEAGPGSALYMANIALTCRDWGHTFPKDSQERESRYDEAVDWLKRAIAAEPGNPAHYRELSRMYRYQYDYEKAEATLEEALLVDGRTDFDNVEALLDLSLVMVFQAKPERMIEVADRIADAMPQEPGAREFAGMLLLRSGAEIRSAGFQEYAGHFVRAARHLCPDLRENETWAREAESVPQIHTEASQLMRDDRVQPHVFALYVGMLAMRMSGVDVDEEHFYMATVVVERADPREIAAGARAVQRLYPVVAAVTGDFLERAIAAEHSAPSCPKGQGGCATLVVSVALIVLVACAFL